MRGQRKNPRKAVQPFENKKRKIDIFKNYEANGVEKIQRKLEIFSTLISKKSRLWVFELKTAHEGKSAEAALQEAIDQLTSRRYGEQDAVGKLERVALVFSLTERRFVRWATVSET